MVVAVRGLYAPLDLDPTAAYPFVKSVADKLAPPVSILIIFPRTLSH